MISKAIVAAALEAAKRFRRLPADHSGATAIWFALVALSLSVLTLGAVDFSRVMSERTRLQDALDAATLMVARWGAQNAGAMDTAGDQAVVQQFAANGGSEAIATSNF